VKEKKTKMKPFGKYIPIGHAKCLRYRLETWVIFKGGNIYYNI
jgi:hypothetical protein